MEQTDTHQLSSSSIEQAASQSDEPLTYWDVVISNDISTYSLHDNDGPFPKGVHPSEVLQEHHPAKMNPRPFIKFIDLNNSDDEPCLNRPHPAVEVGLKFEF